MLKLTTDKHEASRGLSAIAELLVIYIAQCGSQTKRSVSDIRALIIAVAACRHARV